MHLVDLQKTGNFAIQLLNFLADFATKVIEYQNLRLKGTLLVLI